MTVGKKKVDRWKSWDLIGKKAKQKKTLERQDEVTTFCLTVNEKRHTTKKKLQVKGTTQAMSENNAWEQQYTSNPLTECEEGHADRRSTVLNCKEKITLEIVVSMLSYS